MAEQAGQFGREDCTLHYWISGPDDAPALVFSHGATLDNQSWAVQADALAETHRVIRWDLRGHGLSRPSSGAHSIDRFAADLIALLDHLGIGQAVLVGLSLGGYVSQAVAHDHPERVAALAVFDATNLYDTPLSGFMTAMMAQSSLLIGLFPWRRLIEMTARQSAVTPEAQDYIRQVVSQLTKPEYIAIWGAVQTGLRRDTDYRFGGPTLLAMGDRDKVGVVDAGMRHWAKRWPGARFEIVPGAGHCSNQDNPEFVTQVLRDFLQ